MAALVIKTATMNAARAREKDVERALNQFSEEISNVQHNLSFTIKSRAQISSQLLTLAKVSQVNARRVNQLSSALATAIGQYTACENRISGNPTCGKSVNHQKKPSAPQKKGKKKNFWDFIEGWKWVGAAGPVGALVSGIGKAITGADPVKGLFDFSGGVVKAIGAYAKTSKPSFDWKTLFGIGSFSHVEKTNFFKAFGEEFKKLKFSNATKVSEKVAVAAKWGGYAITGITTFYENFHDESNVTFERKLSESLGESAVKIGGGILIGAGVAAGFAAAGVAAPAVVVGGVTVGVTWLINKGFEAATGKGAAEAISDWVLDGGIQKTAKSVGDAVGKAAKTAGKKISGWWNSLW